MTSVFFDKGEQHASVAITAVFPVPVGIFINAASSMRCGVGSAAAFRNIRAAAR